MMENRSTARGLCEGIKETSVVMPVIHERLGLHKDGYTQLHKPIP
jgi:hypothetical protein